jgi:hypothetical protein
MFPIIPCDLVVLQVHTFANKLLDFLGIYPNPFLSLSLSLTIILMSLTSDLEGIYVVHHRNKKWRFLAKLPRWVWGDCSLANTSFSSEARRVHSSHTCPRMSTPQHSSPQGASRPRSHSVSNRAGALRTRHARFPANARRLSVQGKLFHR